MWSTLSYHSPYSLRRHIRRGVAFDGRSLSSYWDSSCLRVCLVLVCIRVLLHLTKVSKHVVYTYHTVDTSRFIIAHEVHVRWYCAWGRQFESSFRRFAALPISNYIESVVPIKLKSPPHWYAPRRSGFMKVWPQSPTREWHNSRKRLAARKVPTVYYTVDARLSVSLSVATSDLEVTSQSLVRRLIAAFSAKATTVSATIWSTCMIALWLNS